MSTSSTLSWTEEEVALAFRVPTASLWLRYVRSCPLILRRMSPKKHTHTHTHHTHRDYTHMHRNLKQSGHPELGSSRCHQDTVRIQVKEKE